MPLTTNQGTIDFSKSLVEITDKRSIVTDGPLAEQYCKALQEVFKKEIDPITGISIETQAIDAINAKNMWLATIKAEQIVEETPVGVVYGVPARGASSADVVRVADILNNMTDEQKANSAVIFDEADMNKELTISFSGEKSNPFQVAIESFCQQKGLRVFSSLVDYAKHIRSA